MSITVVVEQNLDEVLMTFAGLLEPYPQHTKGAVEVAYSFEVVEGGTQITFRCHHPVHTPEGIVIAQRGVIDLAERFRSRVKRGTVA